MASYKIELCSEDVNQSIEKASFVDQIEFCADLANDGLTPSISDVKQVLDCQNNALIKVMIRNRPGDFHYSEDDLGIMLSQADDFKALGVNHFVFGALTEDNKLDIGMIKRFAAHVYPASICIHKAIDLSNDILTDTKLLMAIENVIEILTSGGQLTALDGQHMIREMIAVVQSRIDIVAAGKITYENIDSIHNLIGAPKYHGKNIIK
jgi:copper homeostasis protein